MGKYIATADLVIDRTPFKAGEVVAVDGKKGIEPVEGVTVGHVEARLGNGLVALSEESKPAAKDEKKDEKKAGA